MEMAKSKKFWQTLDDDGLPPSAQLRLDQLTASKYWRNGSILRVHIMDGGTTTQRSFVKNTLLGQWGRFIHLKIDFVDEISPSDVRISIRSRSTPDENLGLGASWIGVDARNYGDKEWTMGVKIEDNPEVSMGDQGTVLHEFGHALALHHQHQRSDRPFHINLSVVWNFYRLNGDNHLHKQFLRYCIVDKLDHDILHPVPYDWDSIMHYPFTASMMKPYGSFVPRDVQRNNSLSNGDVTTVRGIRV